MNITNVKFQLIVILMLCTGFSYVKVVKCESYVILQNLSVCRIIL